MRVLVGKYPSTIFKRLIQDSVYEASLGAAKYTQPSIRSNTAQQRDAEDIFCVMPQGYDETKAICLVLPQDM